MLRSQDRLKNDGVEATPFDEVLCYDGQDDAAVSKELAISAYVIDILLSHRGKHGAEPDLLERRDVSGAKAKMAVSVVVKPDGQVVEGNVGNSNRSRAPASKLAGKVLALVERHLADSVPKVFHLPHEHERDNRLHG